MAERLGLRHRSLDALARCPEIIERIQRLIDEANEELATTERIVKFKILPNELTPESGDVTAAMGLRRDAILSKYADLIEAMYRT